MKSYLKILRYLIEYYIFIIFFYFLRALSLKSATCLCAWLAKLIGPLLSASKLAKKNINYVGIEKSDKKISFMVSEAWDNFGRFIAEFAHLSKLSDQEISQMIEIENFDRLQQLVKNNEPFILFTGHFANWDLALSQMSKLNIEISVVYRKANNPYVDKIIRETRLRKNINLIEKGPQGFKELIKSLRLKRPIIMLVDQRMNQGIEVPFMGRPAMTADAIAKIALQFNYKVIPAQIIRIHHSSKFKAIIHDEIKIVKTDNTEQGIYEILLKINKMLESWVMQNPTQWFWFHNRWGIKR
jgi:KDO2-lipid IV(A) lauroyltransferase